MVKLFALCLAVVIVPIVALVSVCQLFGSLLPLFKTARAIHQHFSKLSVEAACPPLNTHLLN